jgi:endonuclease III
MARHTQAPRLQKETLPQKRKRTRQLIDRLKAAHPDARCSLNYSNPLELLVATVLSAQCTDERVNRVTESLFKKYRTASDYAGCSAPHLSSGWQLSTVADVILPLKLPRWLIA